MTLADDVTQRRAELDQAAAAEKAANEAAARVTQERERVRGAALKTLLNEARNIALEVKTPIVNCYDSQAPKANQWDVSGSFLGTLTASQDADGRALYFGYRGTIFTASNPIIITESTDRLVRSHRKVGDYYATNPLVLDDNLAAEPLLRPSDEHLAEVSEGGETWTPIREWLVLALALSTPTKPSWMS